MKDRGPIIAYMSGLVLLALSLALFGYLYTVPELRCELAVCNRNGVW